MAKTSAQGQVITRFGAELIVQAPNEAPLRCTSRRKFEHVCCGDYVTWQQESEGNAALSRILPRKNVLTRPDFRGKPRPVAANIDQLIIVMSWLPRPQWPTLDRYLIASHQLDITPLIVINKSDLETEQATPTDHEILQEYIQVGYTLLHTSTQQADSIQQLEQHLSGKTSILVGQSGVGKSSLSRMILPELDIRVGAISDNGEGRHTTTGTTLYHLAEAGKLIDSPGARDYTLPTIDESGLREGYPEFHTPSQHCRFNNCTHQHEPGCEIKYQVENGEIPAKRYQRYLDQLIQLNEQ